MPNSLAQRLHQIFEVSLLTKGMLAAGELGSGVVLFLFGPGRILDLVNRWTAREITEDPTDIVATALLHFAQGFSIQTQQFYALYFATHGAVKLVMVGALMLRIMWAYPASIVMMAGFIAYQLYVYSFSHSAGLLALTALDLVIIALIWREYRDMRGKIS
ncbi:MAG TPA: DUF2127 domain-containing protein [Paracoccaceae bacterium]|nr:DUF2127 domain-containing protein [Paracoccaceae bacterium]